VLPPKIQALPALIRKQPLTLSLITVTSGRISPDSKNKHSVFILQLPDWFQILVQKPRTCRLLSACLKSVLSLFFAL